jgi:hypothetical protein
MFDAIGAPSKEEAATWCIQYRGESYVESFIAAAPNLGVLLTCKKWMPSLPVLCERRPMFIFEANVLFYGI